MGTRVFYEVDPFNRLVVKQGRVSRLKKFRKVVTGRFKTDSNNALSYEVNKSAGLDVPQKINFSGRYKLDKEHNLVYTLDKWNNQCEGNRLTFKTKIIDAASNEIAFLINSKMDQNKRQVYIMKLCGSWMADRRNRLTFGIDRESGRIDKLTLSGAWEINKNNEIIYRHCRDSGVLSFRGHWDIRGRYRLNYIMDRKTDSGLFFKTSLGNIAPKGRDTYVTFDIGIGVSRTKKIHRRVIFGGRWKIDKTSELILQTSDIENGGATLRFTKEMFDRNGLAYVESIVRDKERFIGGGMTFRW